MEDKERRVPLRDLIYHFEYVNFGIEPYGRIKPNISAKPEYDDWVKWNMPPKTDMPPPMDWMTFDGKAHMMQTKDIRQEELAKVWLWDNNRSPPPCFLAEYRAVHALFEMSLIDYCLHIDPATAPMSMVRAEDPVTFRNNNQEAALHHDMGKIFYAELINYFTQRPGAGNIVKMPASYQPANVDRAWYDIVKRYSEQDNGRLFSIAELIRYMGQADDGLGKKTELMILSKTFAKRTDNYPTHWACVQDTHGNPSIWACFSLVPMPNNQHAMVLHGWSRSLLGAIGRKMIGIDSKPIGQATLSLLLHAARKWTVEPISVVFLFMLKPTIEVVTGFNQGQEKIQVYSMEQQIPKKLKYLDKYCMGERDCILIPPTFADAWQTQFVASQYE